MAQFVPPSRKAISDLDTAIKTTLAEQDELLVKASELAVELGKLRAARSLLTWESLRANLSDSPLDDETARLAPHLVKESK